MLWQKVKGAVQVEVMAPVNGVDRHDRRYRRRVAQDFLWLGAAVNLARLAVLGARSSGAGGWAIAGC
jgi:hypothetical protein